MEKEQLFAMRKSLGIDFGDMPSYVASLKDFFANPDSVPFVCGYIGFPQNGWEVKTLPPIASADKLTLLMFINRIDVTAQQFKDWDSKQLDFRRASISQGIDAMTRGEIGDEIAATSFNMQGIGHSLSLRWQIDNSGPNPRSGYSAKHTIYLPRTHSVLQHGGPNIEIRFQ